MPSCEVGRPTGEGLEARVVEYPDGPDRCTIYPRGLSEADRVTTWLSADRAAFVSLDLYR